MFKNNNLDMETSLFLSPIHVDFLDPITPPIHRNCAITTTPKPDDWHNRLKKGKLYSIESRKFDIELENKYLGAINLFKTKSETY